MKKSALAALAVSVMILVMGASSYAATPVSATVEKYGYLAGSTTRTNLNIRFFDDQSNMLFEPGTMVQVWARHTCGSASTTATVILHNGQTVVMRKGFDYTFFVPLIWPDWVVEINANISEDTFRNETAQTGCFQMAGYGPDGQTLPGGWY